MSFENDMDSNWRSNTEEPQTSEHMTFFKVAWTSMQCHNIASTFTRPCINVVCPLGCVSFVFALHRRSLDLVETSCARSVVVPLCSRCIDVHSTLYKRHVPARLWFLCVRVASTFTRPCINGMCSLGSNDFGIVWSVLLMVGWMGLNRFNSIQFDSIFKWVIQ